MQPIWLYTYITLTSSLLSKNLLLSILFISIRIKYCCSGLRGFLLKKTKRTSIV